MKMLLMILCVLLSTPVLSQSSSLRIQNWVLEAVAEMPSQGGYQLTIAAPRSMQTAFSWKTDSTQELLLDAEVAKPSYCTTATYMVFYKVLQKYWAANAITPSEATLAKLKPMMEADGARIWGRWNSNGPGTAKFLHDAQMGINFDDITQAQPGDFLKIYWNNQVGRDERGHSVIYLGRETINGVEMIRYWGSSKATNGFGDMLIPRTTAIKTLFSRLTNPEMFEAIAGLEEVDVFLESMLTQVSSWRELRNAAGVSSF